MEDKKSEIKGVYIPESSKKNPDRRHLVGLRVYTLMLLQIGTGIAQKKLCL